MKRTVTVIVGGQFGSEAKGKVVQYLAHEFDVGVRGGSPNAGHTVVTHEETYKLQHIPATFLQPTSKLYIGAGAVLDRDVLQREVQLQGVFHRLIVDAGCSVITDAHKMSEQGLVSSIGSTGKGCGAALINRIERKEYVLALDSDIGTFCQLGDVATLINDDIDTGATVLVEGSQGFGLSLYHGTYPYTTSRDTTASGVLAEIGISPRHVQDIILVIRTFPIRVAGNSGPLPYEISRDELSRRTGKEIIEMTTVTGKVRRVAEFDREIVKKAILVNRPTQIALQFLNYLFPNDEGVQKREDLSPESREYIIALECELQVPITLIGTGKYEEEMVDRRESLL